MQVRLISILAFVGLLLSNDLIGQDIYSSGALSLPTAPATSYEVTSGQTVHIYGGSSVVLVPGTSFDPGSNVTISVSPAGVVPLAPSNPSLDAGMNWKISTAYDGNGNVLSNVKAFYNELGSNLQTQSMIQYRYPDGTYATHVCASQPILDAYGRPVLTTMAAPTNNSAFAYAPNFVQNDTGKVYNHFDFDLGTAIGSNTQTDNTNTPNAVGSSQIGTLGWYYSAYNTWENYTPNTQYPYVRNSYYQDGTDDAKKEAGAGEAFIMGSGHETGSYSFPVINDLALYLQIRNTFFGSSMGASPSSITNGAVETVSYDQNGTEVAVIKDLNGKTLMTAIPGTDLTVSNQVTVIPTLSEGSGIYYFSMLSSNTVVISGGSYTLYNMTTEQPTSFSGSGTLATGFYKLVNTSTSNVSLTYTNGYSNIAYSFYNQLGDCIAAIAPNGVKLLENGGSSNYSSANSLPYTTINTFDVSGRLLSRMDPDNGLVEYVYRMDGKLRFSQNAKEQITGQFGYVDYDAIGRVVESGEYMPGSGGISFTNNMTVTSGMQSIVENTTANGGLINGTQTDVTRIHYDETNNSYTLSAYQQDPFNLKGAVSYSERFSQVVSNVSSDVNLVSRTWYNYDEEGHVLWTIKDIPGLGYKTMDYTYDNTGRKVKQVFQASTAAETFVHYYSYDRQNGHLLQVFTNTVDNPATEKLQVNYIYSLTGNLRRTELGGNLQGIDYTYTLQGGLKAINNSNQSADPGLDGNNGFPSDAFGMVLDYYSNDYKNVRTGIPAINGVSTPGITDSYAGQIKAMTWFTNKPTTTTISNAPDTYVYTYDNKYQFTSGTWAGNLSFATTPATYTSTTVNNEAIVNPATGASGYDYNGNILNLQRTDNNGTLQAKFAYNYAANSNQLTSIVNSSTGTAQTYGTYTYDQIGEMVGELTTSALQPVKYFQYDGDGKVISVARDPNFTQLVAQFVYDESGTRIIKKSYNTSYQLTQLTYYVDGVVYTQNVTTSGPIVLQEYMIDGGGSRLGTYYPQIPQYAYELKDHLGNVRAVVASSGNGANVVMFNDYYPFGLVLRTGGANYRYGYQGESAEADGETGLNSFDLRMYDPTIGRWLTTDPDGQHYSPYLAMGNDPINSTDPTGGDDGHYIDENGNVVYDADINSQEDLIARGMYLATYLNDDKEIAPITIMGTGGSSGSGGYRAESDATYDAPGYDVRQGNIDYAHDTYVHDAVASAPIQDFTGFWGQTKYWLGGDQVGNFYYHSDGTASAMAAPIQKFEMPWYVTGEIGSVGEGSQLLLKAAPAVLTEDGFAHIAQGHWFSSSIPNKGKFAQEITRIDLEGMIETATTNGTFSPNTNFRPGTIAEYDFGTLIGINKKGIPTSNLRVIIGVGGSVVTAFPY